MIIGRCFRVKFLPDVLFFLQNLYDTVTRANENKKKGTMKKKEEKVDTRGNNAKLKHSCTNVTFLTLFFVVVETFQFLLRLLDQK